MDSALTSAPQTPTPEHPKETMLLQAKGVLVTTHRLVMGGQSWLLGEVERVETIRRGPRVLPLLCTLGLGVLLGLPALHAAMAAPGAESRGGLYGAALAVAGLSIFGSIAGLLMMEDKYWLVVWTRQHARQVFRSQDHQLVSRLAVLVSEAVEAARDRA